jgi:DNA primase small subunit
MNLTKLYLEKKFEEYYSRNDLALPTRYKNREFAFVPLELLPDFVMLRHISFKSYEDFKAYVLSKVPAHIYFSSAYYEKPDEAKMEDKGWIGADLIFDIDADHLPVKTQSLDKALELSKREVKKLVAVLRSDFGIRDMNIYFSGGRGYHVHIHDDEFLGLGSGERREIVDYLTLNSPKIVEDGRLLESNAARRVVNYMRRKLDEDEALSRKLKIKPKEFRRDRLTKKAVKAIEKFREEAERVLRIHIDAPVTADVKRLIRLPGSLHGKTGLRVTEVWDIDEFNPLKDAVAFGDEEVVLRVNKRINLKIGDMNTKIYPGRIKLPEYAAIFLICRGIAVYEGMA